MNLTEEQKALYRAVADGKRVEMDASIDAPWMEWTPDLNIPLGDRRWKWRIAPETITITIPRPKDFWRYSGGIEGASVIAYDTEADAQAFIDAVRGAK